MMTKTTFKCCLDLCCLSQKEAAEFLGVSEASVKSWSSGRRVVTVGVWELLSSLYIQVKKAEKQGAEMLLEQDEIDERAYNELEVDLISDPLPTVGSMKAAGAGALLLYLAEKKNK